MNPFSYQRASEPDAAIRALSSTPNSKFLGGGTNLIDLMKDNVEHPTTLIDITRLQTLATITAADGGHRIGALVRNSDLANDPAIRTTYPLLSQTILAGASPQLRNLATTGGNLMQRTRCYYFTDTAFPACNKRVPGSGCAAIKGFNRVHAVLGQTDEGPTSPHTCIATNPGDMSIAMAALGAVVETTGPKGKRTLPVRDFHRLVGNDPTRDTNLEPDELITGVLLPAAATKFSGNSYYLKARDRQSYAFALVSVASGLQINSKTIQSAGIALGGVAHKPWTSPEAEAALIGKPADEKTFRRAAEILTRGAKGYEHNSFKIQLANECIVRALTLAAEGAAAQQGATASESTATEGTAA